MEYFESEGKAFDSVGTSAGMTPDGLRVVGILLPKENPTDENDFHEIFLTIPAAQSLLLDLKDMIDSVLTVKLEDLYGEGNNND